MDSSDDENSFPDNFLDACSQGDETSTTKMYKIDYEILDVDKVHKEMSAIITEVNNLLKVPITTVRILLNYCRWDKEKLVDQYYEDQADLLNKAGLNKMPPVIGGIQDDVMELECQICFLTCNIEEMACLDCYHLFCNDCWKNYIQEQINGEGVGDSIECVQPECHFTVSDDMILSLISDDRTRNRYKRIITKNFVAFNRLMRWCPSPDCSNAVKIEMSKPIEIQCECGYSYCFSCTIEYHEPATCDQIKKFHKETQEDIATNSWKAQNTKPCPKCNSPIEKNGGCNHITCKSPGCKHEFCWICFGDWRGHGPHGCNRYAPSTGQMNYSQHLDRFKHFSDRFKAYTESQKLEEGLAKKVANIIQQVQEPNQANYLQRAITVLLQCRQTLKYSFIFAFYLDQNNQSKIFELNQLGLEQATETLSRYLENDINFDNVETIKQRVTDKFLFCESRRARLLDHVREGIERESWQYLGIS